MINPVRGAATLVIVALVLLAIAVIVIDTAVH